MKLTICTGPISQGHPQKQLDLYIDCIRRAVAEGADVIVLAVDFPDVLASAARRTETHFARTAGQALTALATVAPQQLLIGQSRTDSTAAIAWAAHRGQVTMLDDSPLEYAGERIFVATGAPRDIDADSWQICLCQRPFDKYGSPLPIISPRTLCVSPLGVHDCGSTLTVYDGRIRDSEHPHGIHALQATPCRFICENGRFTLLDDTANEDVSALDVLRFALKEICARWHIEHVTIGLSGGIDSAFNLMLYRSIFDSDRLLAVNMPSAYNSGSTKQIARELAQTLDVPYLTIPIQASAEYTRQQLDEVLAAHHTGKSVSDFVFENIQARDRSARVLAALSAIHRGVFTCNANKTEMTVGYGTMYGDISGFLCAIGDLWKHEVYAMAEELNRREYQEHALPPAALSLPPSAELSPAQNPEQGQGDPLYYPYHDCLFRAWTEGPNPPDLHETVRLYRKGQLADAIRTAADLDRIFPTEDDFLRDARRWWRMYRGLAVAKRRQAPPLIALSPYPLSGRDEAQYESDDSLLDD